MRSVASQSSHVSVSLSLLQAALVASVSKFVLLLTLPLCFLCCASLCRPYLQRRPCLAQAPSSRGDDDGPGLCHEAIGDGGRHVL